MSRGIYNQNTGYHNRRSIRLRVYDYSQQGYYFITICIYNPKQCLFGYVDGGIMILNDAGEQTKQCWLDIPIHFPHAKLDEFVIMPDHIHGIIHLTNRRVTACRVPTMEQFGKPTVGSIPTIIRSFKSAVSKRIHATIPKFKWQPNYFEHIIGDGKSLYNIRRYISKNPANWNSDSEKQSKGVVLGIKPLQKRTQ